MMYDRGTLDYLDGEIAEREKYLKICMNLIEQYRAEIGNRGDLMEEGFCQGFWFEETYKTLKNLQRAGWMP